MTADLTALLSPAHEERLGRAAWFSTAALAWYEGSSVRARTTRVAAGTSRARLASVSGTEAFSVVRTEASHP